MAQYPIPQFIESEGKIISFLTFRQFFILVGGGAVCFLLYYILPFSFFIVLSIGIMVLAVVVGFLEVGYVSVVTILFTILKFSANSKTYVWKKKEAKYPFKFKDNPSNTAQTMEASQPRVLDKTKKIIEYRKKS